MMDIEKLAIECGAKYIIEMPCEYYKITPKQLKAFAKAMLEAQESEPVAKVVRNESGQISMQKPNGDYFDISKYIGTQFYTHPPADKEVNHE